MTRVVTFRPLRRVGAAADKALSFVQDAVSELVLSIQEAFDRTEPRWTVTDIKRGNYQARAGELVRFDASHSPFSITSPRNPDRGDRFGVKNVSHFTGSVTVQGGGDILEAPSGSNITGSFDTSGSVGVGYQGGLGVQWAYDGTEWLVMPLLRQTTLVASSTLVQSETIVRQTVTVQTPTVGVTEGVITQFRMGIQGITSMCLGTDHAVFSGSYVRT